jgi:hypothetical protein
VLKVRRALRPEINDDIQDRSARATHKFRFGSRGILEVHPAQSALSFVESNVPLSDDRLQPMFLELILTKGTAKETSGILFPVNINDERALQSGFGEDHSTIISWLLEEDQTLRLSDYDAFPFLHLRSAPNRFSDMSVLI